MPGTQTELSERGHVSRAAVCRWLVDLLETKKAHICGWFQNPHGGPVSAIYDRGHAKSVTPKKPRVKTQLELTRSHRKKLRASGEWEDRLALRRAQWKADHPTATRDPLTKAFSAMIGPHA